MGKDRRTKSLVLLMVSIIYTICCMQTAVAADAEHETQYTSDILKYSEKIKDFDGGSLYKVLVDDKARDVMVYKDGRIEVCNENSKEAQPERAPLLNSRRGNWYNKEESYLEDKKIEEALAEKLTKAPENEQIAVGLWFQDINTEEIEEQALQEAGISRLETADASARQQFIEIKRRLMKEAYTEYNKSYYNKYSSYGTILYTSYYAPFIVTLLPVKSIEEISKDYEITGINMYYDLQKCDETSYSIPNINANYTRNTLNLKGSGVKIGVLEMSYPDLSNKQLSDRNIIFDVSKDEAKEKVGSHATRVTSIIAGKTEGIAPEATVYCATSPDRIGDFNRIQWLIDQGVNVINYSAGYQNQKGIYTDMAKWIDHLAYQLDVTFVKSAGNCGPEGGITDPGMAYNGITVGSICDNDSGNEPNWSDDYFSEDSAFLESVAGFKPDLTAPGQGINVAGFTNYSGTSFSAPHVTGVIAQLLEFKPDLKTKASSINALLKAGTTHRTADDYGKYSLSPNYSNKEGAGVVDAKGAYNTANGNQYMELNLSAQEFPYNKNIKVNDTTKPLRVAINWLKQNTVIDGTLTDRDLSDLDLQVYNPDGTLAKSSCSANNNTELVEFVPTVKGTYRIQIDGYHVENEKEVVGLAWNQ